MFISPKILFSAIAVFFILLNLLCLFSLTACTTKNNKPAAHQLSQTNTDISDIKSLPPNLVKTANTYLIKQSLRDPFQRLNNADNSIAKRNQIFIHFPLQQLRIVGSIKGDKRICVLIAAPTGEIAQAQLGDVVGQYNGIITSVNSDSIKVLQETEVNGVKEKIWQTLGTVDNSTWLPGNR